jgi:hypothetical protein
MGKTPASERIVWPDSPRLQELRDDLIDVSVGARLRSWQYVQRIIRRLADCCDLVESLEDERKRRGASNSGDADGDASISILALCDELVDSANALGRALIVRVNKRGSFYVGKISKYVTDISMPLVDFYCEEGYDAIYSEIGEIEKQMKIALDKERNIDKVIVNEWRRTLKPLIDDAIEKTKPSGNAEPLLASSNPQRSILQPSPRCGCCAIM